jgi:hypothetical protein
MKKGTLSIGFTIPLTLIILTAAALILMNQARADGVATARGIVTRQSCYGPGAGNIGRSMGNRNAQRLFGAIWARLGQTCDKLDRLGEIISETPLAAPSMGGVFSACFYMGYTDTLWGQLAAAYDRCQVRCFNEGSDIGKISAEGYCAASIAVGGLYDPGFIAQPPLPFCGENLVFGCKSQYLQTATSEINGCFGYTTGGFTQTFENSIRQDCFVPSDVPIRDHLRFDNGEEMDLSANSSTESALALQ